MKPFKLISLCFLVLLGSTLYFSCNKDTAPKSKTTQGQAELKADPRGGGSSSLSMFGSDHSVPDYVARKVAEKITVILPDAFGSETPVVETVFPISSSEGTTMMYIVNYEHNGFVVISGDDRYQPICAVVPEGRYEAVEVPGMMLEWLDNTYERIEQVKRGEGDPSQLADGEWMRIIKQIGAQEYLLWDDCCPECPNYPECLTHPTIGCGEPDINCNGGGGNGDPCWPYTTTTKGPLMTTNWNQGCTYNNLCPNMNCDACFSNDNAWTGCVATAMAQIIRYWAAPTPQGYNYATMPNNSGNGEVQRLMRDAGDAVDMDYGCDGSGADGDKTDNAFKNDFDYATADRNGYGSGSYQVVMQDLNANKPVLLDGCRTRKKKFPWLWYTYSNCHMWVCDGYQHNQNSCYSTLFFHMNWGWGGFGNGWFGFNNWNSPAGNYQYAQDFTHNIHP